MLQYSWAAEHYERTAEKLADTRIGNVLFNSNHENLVIKTLDREWNGKKKTKHCLGFIRTRSLCH